MSQTPDKVRARLQAKADKLAERAGKAHERHEKAMARLQTAENKPLRVPRNTSKGVADAMNRVREANLKLLRERVTLARRKWEALWDAAQAAQALANNPPAPKVKAKAQPKAKAARATARATTQPPSFCRDDQGRERPLSKEQTDTIKRILGRRVKGVLAVQEAEAVLSVLDHYPNGVMGAEANAADSYCWRAKGRKRDVLFEVEEDGLHFSTFNAN
jgi:hypothetical protein